ncbi:MAG TPA: class I SAM-dependent methyltransferase [Thermomicrobiales bacterium]|nr:class I SAM-dependent methyltransferase [Thermomicrobiales bacterium]
MPDREHADRGGAAPTAHVRKNRALWEATGDEYERRHAADLAGERAMAWGLWRLPEADLRVLGEVAGRDVLELGCGAARWSLALTRRGARPIGLDLSRRQLTHARRLMRAAGVAFPLVEASAEAVPLRDTSFDIVFCDWGAMTFCDPRLTIPEVARLLRPGGLFAFATASPIAMLCRDLAADRLTRTLVNDYFGMSRFEWPDEVDFQLPYGEWLRLFRQHGLAVEDLIETRPPAGATSSYRDAAETEWAHRWPMENIWRVRKGE